MNIYRLLADAMVVLHFGYIAVVVGGMLLILVGIALGWRWVRNFWFRLVHFLMIGVVAAQSVCDVTCPLTTWEMALRSRAGSATYEGAFIAHWLHTLLYYRAPAWVFALVYTLFGLTVVLTWLRVRPRPFGKSARRAAVRR